MMEDFGFHSWIHQSFVWENPGYESFGDYLSEFKSSQRKNIRREIKAMEKQGLSMKIFAGESIPENFLSVMYDFYVRTNTKFGPWGCRYLTQKFFEGIGKHYKHRLLFVAAFEKKKTASPSAMAMLVVKGNQLYGRYWGSDQNVDFLHFNTCYYQPIRWAIENGIRDYHPGAGGFHKVRRGFKSVASYSLLHFYDKNLQNIMVNHIGEINSLEQKEIDQLNSALPFSSDKNYFSQKA